MRESELLGHIFDRSADLRARFPWVLAGPGHDCAVVEVRGGAVLLKTDQVVEGRHFRPPPATAIELIARKAVGRAVSDIAASAGRPLASLAAATIPAGCDWADGLFDAMARWASTWGCPLVGGDIATLGAGQAGPMVLTVSVLGLPHPSRGPVLRSGAKPGDVVAVTGDLGGSLDSQTGLGRHLEITPRLEESAWLADTLGAGLRAMMDVSDGLGRDAGRLARMSGVGIEIEAEAIPLSGAARAGRGWLSALADGEDHELLMAIDACRAHDVRRCPATGTVLTVIGRVVEGPAGVRVRTPDGRVIEASELGWEHGA